MSDSKDAFDLSAPGSAVAVSDLGELSAEDKADLVKAIKNELKTWAPEKLLQSLEPNVRSLVESLQKLQSQHDKLEAEFFLRRADLEKEYQNNYQELYSKRYDVVNGVTKDDSGEAAAEKNGVPNFWLNAMQNHGILSEEIQETDEAALGCLKNIMWYKMNEPKGFKLEFHFSTNKFFKNEVLTKEYHMINEDEPILYEAKGTEIDWHPEMNLTEMTLKKLRKVGDPEGVARETTMEPCESFFRFFSPPNRFFSPPNVLGDDEENTLQKQIEEQLQKQIERDFSIGCAIRDKIIPHAVSWFTGEAAQDELFDGIMEDDEDDNENEHPYW